MTSKHVKAVARAQVIVEAYNAGYFCNCRDNLENLVTKGFELQHRDNCIGRVKAEELLREDKDGKVQP